MFSQENNPFNSPILKVRKTTKGKGRNFRSTEEGAGMTATGARRVSFACRFAGMKGPMKDSKGKPTRKAIALKKWGFGSVEAARSFCQKNKKK